MEGRARETWQKIQKYEEAKKSGDLEAMFRLVDNGKQLYCARSKCNGMANFIKRKVPKIKQFQQYNFNWFSIQKINRAEAFNGDEENCCVQITLQPRSSSRTKVNPIQTLFTKMGLCKSGGRTQPIICNSKYGVESGHVCFSFADRPLEYVFDKVDRGAETLLVVNHFSLTED